MRDLQLTDSSEGRPFKKENWGDIPRPMENMRNATTTEKRRVARKPTDAPAGRQTMLPTEKQKAEPKEGYLGERASPGKWKKVHRRAGELAMNEGKPRETKEKHLRRAKRELLGLQTLPDPEKP